MAVILPDLKSMETVLNAYNERYADTRAGSREITYEYYYNIEGTEAEKDTFLQNIKRKSR